MTQMKMTVNDPADAPEILIITESLTPLNKLLEIYIGQRSNQSLDESMRSTFLNIPMRNDIAIYRPATVNIEPRK